jgi:two-component system, cell cycle sensor histidine kinase and response regulator CckA
VQGVVRAHQGGIALHSVLGKGTTFQIYLPCAARPRKAPRRATSQSAANRIPIARRTILVVEDEAALRVSISRMLRREGFSVIESANGPGALNLFRDRKDEIDLVLLDAIVPGDSNSSFLAEASAIRPGIIAILMSAQVPKKAAPASHAAQIAGLLRKPFQLRDMVKLIRETLGVSEAHPAKSPEAGLNKAGAG